MKVERTPIPITFVPYALIIQVESAQDEGLLRGFLNKMECEVKHGGLYADIINKVRAAIGSVYR